MVTSGITKIREYTRKLYTIKHKRSTVRAVCELLDSQQATNIASACRHLNVNRRHFYRWKKLLEGEGNPKVRRQAAHPTLGKQQTAVTCQLSVLHR